MIIVPMMAASQAAAVAAITANAAVNTAVRVSSMHVHKVNENIEVCSIDNKVKGE